METTLYLGGPIVTLEEPMYAQALVERGGQITYVGGLEEARRIAGPGARQVDLEGRALLPAFAAVFPEFTSMTVRASVGWMIRYPPVLSQARSLSAFSRIVCVPYSLSSGKDGSS